MSGCVTCCAVVATCAAIVDGSRLPAVPATSATSDTTGAVATGAALIADAVGWLVSAPTSESVPLPFSPATCSWSFPVSSLALTCVGPLPAAAPIAPSLGCGDVSTLASATVPSDCGAALASIRLEDCEPPSVPSSELSVTPPATGTVPVRASALSSEGPSPAVTLAPPSPAVGDASAPASAISPSEAGSVSASMALPLAPWPAETASTELPCDGSTLASSSGDEPSTPPGNTLLSTIEPLPRSPSVFVGAPLNTSCGVPLSNCATASLSGTMLAPLGMAVSGWIGSSPTLPSAPSPSVSIWVNVAPSALPKCCVSGTMVSEPPSSPIRPSPGELPGADEPCVGCCSSVGAKLVDDCDPPFGVAEV